MKFADSLSFVPMALAVAVAISLPNAQDKANVGQVRRTMSDAVAAVTGIFTDRPSTAPATVKVAEARRDAREHWGTTYPESHGGRKSTEAQQTWENRPSGRDYTNGRSVRMNYGESQRDLGARHR